MNEYEYLLELYLLGYTYSRSAALGVSFSLILERTYILVAILKCLLSILSIAGAAVTAMRTKGNAISLAWCVLYLFYSLHPLFLLLIALRCHVSSLKASVGEKRQKIGCRDIVA